MGENLLETLFREDWMNRHPIRHKNKEPKNISLGTKEKILAEKTEMVKKKRCGLGYLD